MKSQNSKKTFLTILFFIFISFSTFSLNNYQKIWSVESEVYEAIENLYIQQGLALPSSTGPWSTAELLQMLELVEDDSFLYQFALNQLNQKPNHKPHPNLGFDTTFNLNIENYIHSNTESAFVGVDKWMYNSQNMSPFFQFDWEAYLTNNFYWFIGFDLRNQTHFKNNKDLGYKNYSTNVAGFQNFEFDMQLNSSFPNRALFSFGGENWSVLLGKDRLSWGHGETGNLVISNNIPSQYLARFSTFFNVFKFSFLTRFFQHQKMYYTNEGWNNTILQATEVQGLRFYMAHRFEGRFFNNKLSVTVTEAMMYQSDDGQFNFKFLNPVDIFHNYYIRSNSNSTLALEIDFSPIKRLNFYSQIISDDFAIFGEPSGGNSDWAIPNALGFMLGTKSSFELNKGVFYTSLEVVKTSPFLYLRYRDYDKGNEDNTYGVDYVVGYGDFNSAIMDEYFLGYPHGGDALVFNLKAGWKNYKNLTINGNIFYMLHGTFDKWTKWTPVGNGSNPNYPKWDLFNFLTTNHPSYNNKDNEDAKKRNAISHTFDIGFNVSYQLNENTKIFMQNDFVLINNYGNHSGVFKSDFQTVFGVKLDWTV